MPFSSLTESCGKPDCTLLTVPPCLWVWVLLGSPLLQKGRVLLQTTAWSAGLNFSRPNALTSKMSIVWVPFRAAEKFWLQTVASQSFCIQVRLWCLQMCVCGQSQVPFWRGVQEPWSACSGFAVCVWHLRVVVCLAPRCLCEHRFVLTHKLYLRSCSGSGLGFEFFFLNCAFVFETSLQNFSSFW